MKRLLNYAGAGSIRVILFLFLVFFMLLRLQPLCLMFGLGVEGVQDVGETEEGRTTAS